MAKQGWISLHRSIQDNWVWDEKPYSKGQAWIDILLLANHQNNKFLLGNQLVEVTIGSFITSELKLAERWDWGRTKVRNFLKLLEIDGMIVKTTDTKKTTIKVVKYKQYQQLEPLDSNTKNPPKNNGRTTDEQRANNERTTDEQRANTNNNDNNANTVNNENNDNKKPTGFALIIDDYTQNPELKKSVIDFIEIRKKNKKNMTENALKLLLKKLDGMSNDESIKIMILNQSIENCWQGIFPLKNEIAENKENPITNNPFLERVLKREAEERALNDKQ